MSASGSDRAIAAVMQWAAREEWRGWLEDVIADHLAPACLAAGVAPDELPDLLGEDAHAQLIGCAFEDFLTREFEPDGRNIVDDYLERRGWTEPVAAKRYLQALRRSFMSVYEVVDTTPGSHFVARDLVRGGEPVACCRWTSMTPPRPSRPSPSSGRGSGAGSGGGPRARVRPGRPRARRRWTRPCWARRRR